MKVRVLSDLHLEFTQYQPSHLPSGGEDLVVLAGDIGEGLKGIQWAKRAIPDRPTIYVMGNHEFYRQDWDELLVKARQETAGTQVHVLENDAIEIVGMRILGCSLWTDFLSAGEIMRPTAAALAAHSMNDFRLIRKDHRRMKLRPADTVWRCQASAAWLEREIATANTPLLVVTHHAPTLRTMNPAFALDPMNPAFHNSFDHLIRSPIVAWIHGHTHYSARAQVNGVPVLSNQRGYPGEIVEFDWDFVIEI